MQNNKEEINMKKKMIILQKGLCSVSITGSKKDPKTLFDFWEDIEWQFSMEFDGDTEAEQKYQDLLKEGFEIFD